MLDKIKGIFKKVDFLFFVFLFFLLNIGFSFLSLKIDLSYGSSYSLSSSTKKILKNLKKPLTINFYVSSSDLPSRLIPLKDEVIDFLKEYKKTSNKITLKILDPKKDSKALDEVQKTTIPELQYSQLEKDSYQVKKVYFGIEIKYNDKSEVIVQVGDLSNLEYNLTSLIYKLTKEKEEKIAIIGKQEVFPMFGNQEDDLANLKKIIRNQYHLDFLDIGKDSSVETIDKSYKLILVFDDNKKTYQEEELKKIKKYLDNGGKAIFFVDGVWVNGQSLVGEKANHNLFSFLKDYGIKLNENLILSFASELVNFGSANYQFITNYPYWVKTNNFSKNSGLFSNISVLTFPWVSSVDFINQSFGKNQILVSSLKQSWEKKYSTESAFFVDPGNILKPKENDLKTFSLIVGVNDKNNQLKLVVIPSSRFVYDQFLGQNNNLEFVYNLIDNISSGGVLSGIRARQISFYQLPVLNEAQKDLVKYLSILVLPTIFGVYGFLRILKRSKKSF